MQWSNGKIMIIINKSEASSYHCALRDEEIPLNETYYYINIHGLESKEQQELVYAEISKLIKKLNSPKKTVVFG